MVDIKYLSFLCSQKQCAMENKQERTVVHLEFAGQHYYFGSLSAIYTKFTAEELSVALGTLRNYGVKEGRPYQNARCVIRKGVLITMPKK